MIRAGIVVLIAIALPFLLGQFWAYQLGLYALYAAAAVGVGLCWGQAGFLPLGQALFFGLAALLPFFEIGFREWGQGIGRSGEAHFVPASNLKRIPIILKHSLHA